MNCIAVDDEPLALDLIEDFIKKIPFLNFIKTCKSAFEAIEILQKEKIDLIFLDIQMPDISGIEFIKSIEKKPMVIFTTAYTDYALEGFKLNAIDYLVKPFPFDRFLKAVNKAYEYYMLKSKPADMKNEKTDELSSEFIFVKADYKIIKINLNDILYIEGLKDYIKIYAGSKPILTLQSLKFMQEKLPQNNFIRVHRSYIVSFNKIDSIQRNRIIIGDKRIPVGDSYKDDFYKMLEKSNL
ncbi:MAG: response regulator transcription factor [Bacteroidales bacterium]|nr:response regulator transcription factor [Bacteroidales bacterium]